MNKQLEVGDKLVEIMHQTGRILNRIEITSVTKTLAKATKIVDGRTFEKIFKREVYNNGWVDEKTGLQSHWKSWGLASDKHEARHLRDENLTQLKKELTEINVDRLTAEQIEAYRAFLLTLKSN